MTSALFHVAPDSLADAAIGATVLLEGPEGRHAAVVRRVEAGEAIQVADGTGRIADCEVTQVGRAELTLTVVGVRDEPQPQPRFVLVQALAKDGRDVQAVEAATELGVDAVIPWQADRSIVQWRPERAAKARAKWESTARAAAKQARRARVPEVAELVRRADLVGAARESALTLVLHEDADDAMGAVDLPAVGDILLVVGPEGGVAPDELDALLAAGARSVRLGRTVLRSSTAGPAALAVLASRTRW